MRNFHIVHNIFCTFVQARQEREWLQVVDMADFGEALKGTQA